MSVLLIVAAVSLSMLLFAILLNGSEAFFTSLTHSPDAAPVARVSEKPLVSIADEEWTDWSTWP